MTIIRNIKTTTVSILVGVSILGFQACSQAEDQTAVETKSEAAPQNIMPPPPWRMAALNAKTLDALPDIDWVPVESGTKVNSETVIFEGENIVSVWDAGPAKLTLKDPMPYDEFVVVLKGTLVLTDNEGNSETYKTGDMFMVPKGFTGTWDMTEPYRELIVVDTRPIPQIKAH